MGWCNYTCYYATFSIEYEPSWKASTLTASGTDVAGLYWVKGKEDIKCDLLGNFVEPPAADKYVKGQTRTDMLVKWSRSICHYPVTVTEAGWSYNYPYVATASESVRNERYTKGERRGTENFWTGWFPLERVVYIEGYGNLWYELNSVTTYNRVVYKTESGQWVDAVLYICNEYGMWVPIDRPYVCVTISGKTFWTY